MELAVKSQGRNRQYALRSRRFSLTWSRIFVKTRSFATLVRITSRRQVTFRARMLDAMGVGQGNRLELQEPPTGTCCAKAHRLLAPGHLWGQDTGRTASASGHSGRSPINRLYGIDTLFLVRLVTADPEPDFRRCVNELRLMIEGQDSEVIASNRVIGEAYIVLQRHCGNSASDVRSGLSDAPTSGLVTPLDGQAVVPALQESSGSGVFDRLIADDHSHAGTETLTLDRQMT